MTRRPATVRSARTALAALAAAAALAAVTPPLGAPAAMAAVPPGPVTPIHHLVLVTQDHRSFDHYFGTRPGVAGLPPHVCLPAGPLVRCAPPFHLTRSTDLTPFNDGRRYLGRQLNGGRMDAFVTAYADTAADGRLTMGHYDRRDLPYYWRLADDYVLFDHFFTALPANGVANRYLAATAAHPPGGVTAVPPGGWPDVPTVFDRLSTAGVSWKVYVERYRDGATGPADLARVRARVPLLAMAGRDPAALRGHVVDLEQYYADAARDRLPAVSWVVATGPTERPPSVPVAGQRFVRGLVTTLQASRAWASSAFLLDYDSSGGWYDHLAPPAWRGQPRGARVPALLVSPYARRGAVDSTVLDSVSPLRFIEENWRLAPLTDRDASSGSMRGAFDFRRPRPADLAAAVPAGPDEASPTRTIYLLYGFALLVVLALGGWLRRHPEPAPAGGPAAPAGPPPAVPAPAAPVDGMDGMDGVDGVGGAARAEERPAGATGRPGTRTGSGAEPEPAAADADGSGR